MTTDHTHDIPGAAAGDVEERVLKVIATTKRLPREAVNLDSSFESLGIDSLDRLNILFDLESEFDIQINDEDAKRVENIRQMVAGVQQLIAANAHGTSELEPNITPLSGAPVELTPNQAAAVEESTAIADPIPTKPASSKE